MPRDQAVPTWVRTGLLLSLMLDSCWLVPGRARSCCLRVKLLGLASKYILCYSSSRNSQKLAHHLPRQRLRKTPTVGFHCRLLSWSRDIGPWGWGAAPSLRVGCCEGPREGTPAPCCMTWACVWQWGWWYKGKSAHSS